MCKFSILIVTFNGRHHLIRCFESLLPQMKIGWEIIIVDNGSTDGTEDYIRSLSRAEIHYVRLNQNRGFAEANNIAVKGAHGEWFFLLNNDTVCDEQLLRTLEDSVIRFRSFHIFACKMMQISDGKIDNVGIQFGRLLHARAIGKGSEDHFKEIREVFGASGGAMLVHRLVIDDIGLFEPLFFAYQEDVDFAVRARWAGYRCLFLANAIVHHFGGGTSSANTTLARYYIQRNMELVLLRSVPIRLLWEYLPIGFAYSVFQVLRWSWKGQGWMVLRAKLDAMNLFRKMKTPPLRVRVSRKTIQQLLSQKFRHPPDGL